MTNSEPDSSTPRRKHRSWLLFILVSIPLIGVAAAWRYRQSRDGVQSDRADYANLLRIRVVINNGSVRFSIKDRWPKCDYDQRYHAAVWLQSAQNRRDIEEYNCELGGAGNNFAISYPPSEAFKIVVVYRVYQKDPTIEWDWWKEPANGTVLYEGRKESGIIDLPAIAREQPSWAKREQANRR